VEKVPISDLCDQYGLQPSQVYYWQAQLLERGATTIAASSTRAKPGAPVSMPIAWEQLGSVTSADQFRLDNAIRRLRSQRRDPWAAVDKARQILTDRMLKQLDG